jgi:hypothetical protein
MQDAAIPARLERVSISVERDGLFARLEYNGLPACGKESPDVALDLRGRWALFAPGWLRHGDWDRKGTPNGFGPWTDESSFGAQRRQLKHARSDAVSERIFRESTGDTNRNKSAARLA